MLPELPRAVCRCCRNAPTSGCVEVGEAELRRLPPDALPGELQQQLEGVAVGGDRVRAGLTLPHQLVGEEPLQQRRQVVVARRSRVIHRLRRTCARVGRRPGRAAEVFRSDTSRSTSGRRDRGTCSAPACGRARRHRRDTSPATWRCRTSAGNQPAVAGAARPVSVMPTARTRTANVRVMLASSRVPRVETSSAGVPGAGNTRSRSCW